MTSHRRRCIQWVLGGSCPCGVGCANLLACASIYQWTKRFFFLIYFIFKLYNIVLVSPNIKMNPPQVYCVPHPEPSSLLPLHTLPLGRPSAPAPSNQYHAAVHGVAKSRTWLSDFAFTFHFHALEKEMATHSSVLAWRIPGTGEPGGCRLWGHTELDTTEAT